MIPKQDRQGIRQAKEIEQKYDLNKDFSSIEKTANNAQIAASAANNRAENAVSQVNEMAIRVKALEDADVIKSFKGRTGAVVPASGDYTPAMVGAAPSGYGWGEYLAKPLYADDDLNQIRTTGVYTWGNSVPKNALTGFGNLNEYCKMVVTSAGSLGAIQEFVSFNNPQIKYQRWVGNGTVGEYEWLNPPMLFGVEYRTTERFNNQPVYIQALQMTNLPTTVGGEVRETYSDTQVTPIAYGGYLPTLGCALPWSGIANIKANDTQMVFVSERTDVTGSVYVWVKYTKR